MLFGIGWFLLPWATSTWLKHFQFRNHKLYYECRDLNYRFIEFIVVGLGSGIAREFGVAGGAGNGRFYLGEHERGCGDGRAALHGGGGGEGGAGGELGEGEGLEAESSDVIAHWNLVVMAPFLVRLLRLRRRMVGFGGMESRRRPFPRRGVGSRSPFRRKEDCGHGMSAQGTG